MPRIFGVDVPLQQSPLWALYQSLYPALGRGLAGAERVAGGIQERYGIPLTESPLLTLPRGIYDVFPDPRFAGIPPAEATQISRETVARAARQAAPPPAAAEPVAEAVRKAVAEQPKFRITPPPTAQAAPAVAARAPTTPEQLAALQGYTYPTAAGQQPWVPSEAMMGAVGAGRGVPLLAQQQQAEQALAQQLGGVPPTPGPGAPPSDAMMVWGTALDTIARGLAAMGQQRGQQRAPAPFYGAQAQIPIVQQGAFYR